MSLVGNGLTTSDAKTKLRISANVVVKSDSDLNSTVASSVPGDGADVGYAFFNCGAGSGTITLSKAGYKTRVEHVTFPIPHNIDYALEPIAPELHLEQRGNDFVDANGKRIVFAGLDGFMDYRIWLDGGPEALRPFMEESRAHGFTVRRVFMMGSKSQNQVLELSPKEARFYSEIRPFVEFQNSYGQIPLLTVNVDAQVQMPDRNERIHNWLHQAAETEGTKRLMSGFNQWSKNGGQIGAHPDELPDPGHGVIWSRGSDVDDTITRPNGAPASELHSVRNGFDRDVMDATASPPFMRQPSNGGATMVWRTEGDPFTTNNYTVDQAWKIGRACSVDWALVVLHNRQSQRGQLMLPDTAERARAFACGMAL